MKTRRTEEEFRREIAVFATFDDICRCSCDFVLDSGEAKVAEQRCSIVIDYNVALRRRNRGLMS
jgi:hypothetical protein